MASEDKQDSWFSTKWIFNIPSWINFFNLPSWINFFNSRPEPLTYNSKETRELINRAMKKRSSFDELSSWWYSLALWEKLANSVLIVATSAILGLLTSSPWLLTLATSIFTYFIHSYLVLHEKNRQEMIKDISHGAVVLRDQLGDEFSSLKNNIALLAEKLKELDQTKAEMEASIATLEAKRQSLNIQNTQIEELIATATVESEATMAVLDEIIKERLMQQENEKEELSNGNDKPQVKVYSALGDKTTFFASNDSKVSYLDEIKKNLEETGKFFEEIKRQHGLT